MSRQNLSPSSVGEGDGGGQVFVAQFAVGGEHAPSGVVAVGVEAYAAVPEQGLRCVREFFWGVAEAPQGFGGDAQREVAEGPDVQQAHDRRLEIDSCRLHVEEGLADERHLPALRRLVDHYVLALGEQVRECVRLILAADEIPAGHVFAIDKGLVHRP